MSIIFRRINQHPPEILNRIREIYVFQIDARMRLQEPVAPQRRRPRIIRRCAHRDPRLCGQHIDDILPVRVRIKRARHQIHILDAICIFEGDHECGKTRPCMECRVGGFDPHDCAFFALCLRKKTVEWCAGIVLNDTDI